MSGAGTANGHWGGGRGGGRARGRFLVRMQSTSFRKPLSAARPLLPRAVCRAAGNRAGQGAQNQESQEDKEMLVGVLGTGGGRRAQGRPRLPTEARREGSLAPRESSAPHPLSFRPDSVFPGSLRPRGRRSQLQFLSGSFCKHRELLLNGPSERVGAGWVREVGWK